MAVRIVWDDDGFQQVLRQRGMQAALREVAEIALTFARASAPVESGRYLRSLHIESAIYLARRGPRPAREVVADVPYAEPVEDRHHVLGRTLSALAAQGLGVRRHRDD